MILKVRNAKGEVVADLEVDETVFGRRLRPALMHQSIVRAEANRRAGTASTRTRKDVAGSGAKLFRQKGTGRARAGPRRATGRVGSGAAFGPHPRSYRQGLPKKARRLALRSVLLSKFRDEEVTVVDRLELGEIKTKEMLRILGDLGIDSSCLIVLPERDEKVWKSARNLPGIEVTSVAQLTAYDILKRERLLLTKTALARLSGTESNAAS